MATRFRVMYGLFTPEAHLADEIFDNYNDADAFLRENGDPETDAVVSWPGTDSDYEDN